MIIIQELYYFNKATRSYADPGHTADLSTMSYSSPGVIATLTQVIQLTLAQCHTARQELESLGATSR